MDDFQSTTDFSGSLFSSPHKRGLYSRSAGDSHNSCLVVNAQIKSHVLGQHFCFVYFLQKKTKIHNGFF